MSMGKVNSDAVRAAADVVDAFEETDNMTVESVEVEPDPVIPRRHELHIEATFAVENPEHLRNRLGDFGLDVTSDHAEVSNPTLRTSPTLDMAPDDVLTGYADYQATILTTDD